VPPLLGCIADDYTGATDLATMLVGGGMRTVQWFGPPEPADVPDDVDALIVALKSRSGPVAEAVEASLAALGALQRIGARRFLFKYCSTFDSTPAGNIGPVAEALMNALGARQTIFSPAFPENGRTVYQGHLFVHGRLLHESGMEHHPLTPMTDANLVRVLQRQATCKVGLLSYPEVTQGAASIATGLERLHEEGISLVICDALDNQHLRNLAGVIAEMPLVTGSAGVALGLPAVYRARGELSSTPAVAAVPQVTGRSAVLAGSCSAATQRQVAAFARSHPSWAIDVPAVVGGGQSAEAAIAWATRHLADGPVLIYSTVAAERLSAVQSAVGRETAAAAAERNMGEIAVGLVALGVRRLVVAGGETAGAVIKALGVQGLRIGPQIDPGVPWTESIGGPRLALALKSGNFGTEDFFQKALEMLP
jgi:uncharacterized protein YgbK (DUF1537 family)